MNKSQVINGQKMSSLPEWLYSHSKLLPSYYKKIWEAVKADQHFHNELLVDTSKIFPLLLTSQLPTEILGFIWNLANQKYSGQLTEQELYIVLALVALAQASYPFKSLNDLHLLSSPVNPKLNLAMLANNLTPYESGSYNTSLDSTNFNFSKKHGQNSKVINRIDQQVVSNTSRYSNNYQDQEDIRFIPSQVKVNDVNSLYNSKHLNLHPQTNLKPQQSHSAFIDNSEEFTEFQSAPIITKPNIPNLWDSKVGSAIGSRLANHNLGVKKLTEKTRKTSGNKVYNGQATISNINSESDKESSSNNFIPELFPKCSVRSNPGKLFILKDTAIRNNSEPCESNIFNNIIKEKKSPDQVDYLPETVKTRKNLAIEPPRQKGEQNDLMNLQSPVDKYSALRELVINQEDNAVNEEDNIKQIIDSSNGDDFGEFISADQFQSCSIDRKLETVDLLSDLDLTNEIRENQNLGSTHSVLQEFTVLDPLPAETKIYSQLEEELDSKQDATSNPDKSFQKEDTLPVNTGEPNVIRSENLARSSSVPSLDLKLFLPNIQDDDQIENLPQMIYWEWKQYMESCILLLQVAASIFTSITSEIVLREVLNSAQGYNFLCNLAEVAAVCRRVNFSHKEIDINVLGFDDLLMDIDRIWSEMEPFYNDIPIVTELPSWPIHRGDGVPCALCLTVINNGRIIYNDSNYHATCANLWLFTVNNNLPALRYPISYTQTSISQNHTQL